MLVAVFVTVVTAITASGLLSSNRTVQSRGSIKTLNVGAYWNSGCTNATVAVIWGMLSPGTSNNVTLYVRNEGNLPVRLSLATQNWSPVNASSYLGLTWNRESQTLAVGAVVSATLTLSVSSSISGITDFSFDIIIVGAEQ